MIKQISDLVGNCDIKIISIKTVWLLISFKIFYFVTVFYSISLRIFFRECYKIRQRSRYDRAVIAVLSLKYGYDFTYDCSWAKRLKNTKFKSKIRMKNTWILYNKNMIESTVDGKMNKKCIKHYTYYFNNNN